MTVLLQTYFMGDGHQRVYRYLDDQVSPWGQKARKKNDKSWTANESETELWSYESEQWLMQRTSMPMLVFQVSYPAGFHRADRKTRSII